jgi:ribonuclease E
VHKESYMLDADNPSNPNTDSPAPAGGEVATPAKKAAKKSPAKKATAKKVAAKKVTTTKVTAKKAADGAGAAESAGTSAEADKPKKRAAKKAAATAEAAPDSGGQAPVAPMVLFQAPEKAAPARKRAAKKTAAAPAETDAATGSPSEGETPATKAPAKRASTRKATAGSAGDTAATADAAQTTPEGDDSEGGEGGARRRRRRGGRRRRRGAGEDGPDSVEGDEAGSSADGEDAEEDADATSRRRRTRVRQTRNPEDEITSIGGSTRLEAKKQRRREGREAGRRRAPIVSEAEFLARREAVDRVMVVRQRADLTQIGVLEDKVLVEHYATRESQTSLIGNIYLGRVQNVLPSMEAVFIDIGKGRNAVLYAGEVNWSALGHKDGQARKVESVLKSGQTILVQVTKDPVGHKGARLTGQISLPGRFLVYVPDGNTSGISRKLPDTERNRLKALLKEIVPDTAGVIVRTAAEGASEEELTQDVERLTTRWAEIEKAVAAGRSPELLYGEPDLTLKVVRDLFTEDFSSLIIEGDEAWELVDGYVAQVAPDLRDRLHRFESTDGKDVFGAHRVDEQIAKGLDRKVWLPSGGSLVIDRTEAMTVVDVNTGKFTGSGGNLEETVTKNNLEAAEEVVRQLRLRDIGGIIVVDFIDMVLESNRDLVLRRLVECLGRDRTRHQVAEVTSLGLVQMTRKRIGTGLLETFGEDCDHCKGRGVIVHDHPIEHRSGPGASVGAGGGMATGGDEPRGRRSRGGRGRSRTGTEQEAVEPVKPSPMALAGTKPHADGEIPDLADLNPFVDGAAPVDEPVVIETPEAAAPKGASEAGPAEPAGTGATEPADEGVPETNEPVAAAPVVVTTNRRRRAARPAGPGTSDAPPSDDDAVPVVEAAEPVVVGPVPNDVADAPVEAAASAVVVTTRRRRAAGRPAGPAAAEVRSDDVSPDAEAPVETDGDEDDGSAPVFHVPVKKKGSRKR